LAGHQPRAPPAARRNREETNKQTPEAATAPPERNAAVTRPRPPQCDPAAPSPWHQESPAGLNSETLPVPRFPRPKPPPTTTTHRLRLTRGKKEDVQFRCGLVGGTTARKGKVRRYWSGSR
jgi:hypothetical protein